MLYLCVKWFGCVSDNRELMELLVLNGASIEADYVNGTPLHSALYHGNVKATKFLLSQGAEVCKHNLELHSLLNCCLFCHIRTSYMT